MNLKNNEDLYNDYIEKVLNIYRLSNKDKLLGAVKIKSYIVGIFDNFF